MLSTDKNTFTASQAGKLNRASLAARLTSCLRKDYDLYLLLIPGVILLLAFKYLPLLGSVIAFKELNLFAGHDIIDSIIKSDWVGMKNFSKAFARTDFLQALANTLIISVYKMVFLMPLPVITALLINEVRIKYFKKMVQSIIILPHFLSWVIIAALFMTTFGSDGAVNIFREYIGLKKVLYFMDNEAFRTLLVLSDGWKSVGYGSIVYLAAIAGINPELYESALIDGCSRLKQIIYITLPQISSTFVLLLLLRLGHILDAGFEQIFVMYNPSVYKAGDIIGTYVYRVGLGQMDFGFGTAIGLFNSAVGFIMIFLSNGMCKKYFDKSIW